MPRVSEICEFIGGRLVGDPDIIIKNVARIQDAEPGDLSFLYLASYQKYLSATHASAVLIKPDFHKTNKSVTYIEVENPNAALQKIIIRYFAPTVALKGIEGSAWISPSARIGKDCAIGKNVIISENCSIGDNTVVYHNTVIMEGVSIGSNCLIYPNVTVREKCVLGDRVIIHSGSVIGSDGFGYIPDSEGIYIKVPQIGNVILEDDTEIGSNVSIDRAAMGSTIIKKGVKIDNLVQIAHNVTVGENTVISAQSGISGSTTVGRSCILAGQAGLAGHLEISDKVIIGAQSGVSKSIQKSGTYSGTYVRELHKTLKIQAHLDNLSDYVKRISDLEKELSELKEKTKNLSENK